MFVFGNATIVASQLVRLVDHPSGLATTLLNGASGESAYIARPFGTSVSNKCVIICWSNSSIGLFVA